MERPSEFYHHETEQIAHLEKLLIEASEKPLPIELETKIVNCNAQEVLERLVEKGGVQSVPEHLLTDERFKRSKKIDKLPASLHVALSDFEPSDANRVALFQALMKLGLNIHHLAADRITVEPYADYGKKKGFNLRLREENNRHFLTVKNELEKGTTFVKREEITVEVKNREALVELLQSLGYELRSVRQKKNTKYKVGSAIVELRQAPYVNPIFEIEAETEAEIESVLAQLGFSTKDASSMGDTEFLRKHLPKQYQKKINKLLFKPSNKEK